MTTVSGVLQEVLSGTVTATGVDEQGAFIEDASLNMIEREYHHRGLFLRIVEPTTNPNIGSTRIVFTNSKTKLYIGAWFVHPVSVGEKFQALIPTMVKP